MEEIKKAVKKYRDKKIRLRSIYLNFRKLNKFKDWSDLVLLNCIIEGLIELHFPYSRKEVYSAFKCINKDDYDSGTKKDVLKNLLRKATNKSILK